MRIVDFTAYRVTIGLRKPIRHASHARSETESIIVRCRLSDGTVGWGEGLPREYVTGETIETAWDLIRSTEFAAQFSGSIQSRDEVLSRVQQFELPRYAGNDRQCYGNSSAARLSSASWTPGFRTEGLPLSTLTADDSGNDSHSYAFKTRSL